MTSKTNTIVKLWLLAIPKSNQLSTKLIKNLAKSQQQHYKDLSPTRQNVYCLTRTLLNHTLAAAFNDKNINWDIEEQISLPPKIALSTNCSSKTIIPKFSISHTKNTVGIAISEANCSDVTQLGLDIEKINSKRNIEGADFFCNLDQLNDLHLIEDKLQQHQYITQLWTQKEAYFKAHSQTILNPDLKALTISSKPITKKYMSSSSINDSTEISVYSDTEILIKPQWITFDALGSVKELLTTEMNWQSYGIHFI